MALAVLLGALAAVIWVIIDWGAWTLILPGRGRPGKNGSPLVPTAADLAGQGFQRLEVQVDPNTRLVGDWRLDAASGGRTLLLLHGFAEDRLALFARALAVAESGWNVVLIDSRGRGESGGKFCTFGTIEAHDVAAIIGELQARIGSHASVCVWGRSMGAAMALGAAVANPTAIRAVVLEAPYTTLKSSVAIALKRRHLSGFLAGPMLARAARLAGVKLGEPAPLELAPRCHQPALLLAGSDDPIAPPAEITRLARLFPGQPQVITVPNARHQDIWDQGGDRLTAEILAFLDRACPGPG